MPAISHPDTAAILDAQDELAPLRGEFIAPEAGLIYLDGNSLGRLPRRALQVLRDAALEQWGGRLVRAWGEGWVDAPKRVGEKIARLVGAAEGQVVVSDSTSVNLFKLATAALSLRPERKTILSDGLNFPSDLYVLQGAAHTLGAGHRLVLAPEGGDPGAAVLSSLSPDTALVALSLVAFKSGYWYDAEAITRRAHEMGALVLWDLCHAAGAVPVDLDGIGADFGVGCTYKYLNGGPGSPAFLYVRQGLQDEALSPLWGWFGDQSPFAFELEYRPAPGIQRFQCGTPPMLSLLAVEPGVDLLLAAGVERLRAKSVGQTEYLIALVDEYLVPLGFTLGTPRQAARRGSHVSIRHPEGYRINRALIEEMGVLPDFRAPDHIRLGIAPLYTTYQEIREAVLRIAAVVREKRYERYPQERAAVT